jgi:hypothetical protein
MTRSLCAVSRMLNKRGPPAELGTRSRRPLPTAGVKVAFAADLIQRPTASAVSIKKETE